MVNMRLAVSLGVRADVIPCTSSKVRWSMVGWGTDFFLAALVAFLLWVTFYLPEGDVIRGMLDGYGNSGGDMGKSARY